MLTSQVLDTFSTLDTARQVAILTGSQLLDTPPGDAVMGRLAGSHPERFDALVTALASAGYATQTSAGFAPPRVTR